MQLKNDAKLLFTGDSVTDCGRARPVGESAFGGLGNGYVLLIDGELHAGHPEKRIRVVNSGVSGDTMRHLDARWQTDVADLRPDWLVMLIGINDVWRQFDSPLIPESHVLPDEYRRLMQARVAEIRPRLDGLVIMSPYMMEPARNDPMRQRMDEYGAICRDIAAANDAIFVDLQAGFDQLLQHYHSYVASGDRIHPNHIGSALISRLFLQAIGA